MHDPRDKDQDTTSSKHCGQVRKGGGWFKGCNAGATHFTGYHTSSSSQLPDKNHIYWYYGGARGNTHNSWKEVEIRLVPK